MNALNSLGLSSQASDKHDIGRVEKLLQNPLQVKFYEKTKGLLLVSNPFLFCFLEWLRGQI